MALIGIYEWKHDDDLCDGKISSSNKNKLLRNPNLYIYTYRWTNKSDRSWSNKVYSKRTRGRLIVVSRDQTTVTEKSTGYTEPWNKQLDSIFISLSLSLLPILIAFSSFEP